MTSEGRATGVKLRAPYLIFLGDEPEPTYAKTGIGIAHWRPELCIGQLRLAGCGADLGLPDMTPAEAYQAGARSIIWGVAAVGGLAPSGDPPDRRSSRQPFPDRRSKLHRGQDVAPDRC